MRKTYEPHQQTTTTEHQVPDLKTGANKCSGFKCFNRYQPSPLPEIIVQLHNIERPYCKMATYV